MTTEITTSFGNMTTDVNTTITYTTTTLKTTFPPCGFPPAVSAATSVVVRDVATYTCIFGYKMMGIPNNMSCINGTWRGVLPSCQYQNNEIKLSNSPTTFIEQEAAPYWLMLIFGTVGVMAAVLLFCCMVVLCLKAVGCQPLIGQTSDGSYICCCGNRKHRQEMQYSESHILSGSTKRQQSQSTGTQIDKQDNGNVSDSSYPPGYISALERLNKPAKDVVNWMPHRYHVRPINTSTK